MQRFALVLLAGLLGACASPQPVAAFPADTPTAATAEATRDTWRELVDRQPLDPDGNPMELTEPSPIDGTYGRLSDIPPQWWRCLRCADYRPAGGLWRLQLDRGVMRIYYALNDWRSIAAYRIEGSRLFLYDDLYCDEEGEYTWSIDSGTLTLNVVNDPCAFELRGKNLSEGSWELCPSDVHDPQAPLGCGDRPVFETLQATDLPVTVTVHEGNVRTFEVRPDLVAVANDENIASPEGVEISYAAGSMEYGVNRVLWWGGEWIEARTALPLEAMGIQFYGTSTIGWASVFFDGVEVWRGDVAAIWDHFGSYGGYIEVSGFEPGEHVLRVELVEGDYRPLTIAVFGFSRHGGVSQD